MKVEKADLITRKDGKYITLDVINYEEQNYAFVNKLTEKTEDPTNELYVFDINGKTTKKVTDTKLLEKLLPIFQKNLENEIKNIMKSDSE